MPQTKIRPYHHPTDWDAVCHIHDRARVDEIGFFVPHDEIYPMSQVAENECFFDGEQFVAEVDGEIVGFMAIDGDELTWLYVNPDHHRRGIGQRLVEFALPKLGPDGYLIAVKGNLNGTNFYKKMGFRVVAEFPGCCQGYGCTCYRFALPGSKHANRPPQPTKDALRLVGDEGNGRAIRGEDGVWRWVVH